MTAPTPEGERPDGDDGVIMAMLARRAGMTEGQLYTVDLTALLVAVLTLTGLPGAHDITDPTGAGSLAPPPPAPAVSTTLPEVAP